MAVASAPGKVLVSGGYLILDRPHAGTVLALDARFYSGVEFVVFEDAPAIAASAAGFVIEVHSPQFHDERRYVYQMGASAAEASLDPLVLDATPPKPNRYVELPLLYGLTFLRYRRGDGFFVEAVERAARAGKVAPVGAPAVGLRITLCADNGFYSQTAELRARSLPPSAASLRSLPQFLPPRTDGGEIAKTGLGSSATLVTSLSAALFHAFGAVELPTRAADTDARPPPPWALKGDAALSLLHNFAQLCHCAAQGKVGSGFDVCVAVYGSQHYTRFSPSTIAPLLRLATGATPPPDGLLACIGGGGEGVRGGASWDHVVEPFQLPAGVEVLMGDVSGGANTPSMVKKVIAWRKSDAGAGAMWGAYAAASDTLQNGLLRLCAIHAKMRDASRGDDAEWLRLLGECGAAEPAAWATMGSVGAALAAVRAACFELRRLLREISRAAETPIEPPEQSALLDATMKVRGVIMAVVPGAGGNDALLALVIPSAIHPVSGGASGGAAAVTTEGTRIAVAELWRSWPAVAPPPRPSVVCELPVGESHGAGDGRNGVLLEGTSAAEALRTARAPPRPPSPSTPIGRKLLRVLTKTELEAAARATVRREVLAIVASAAVLVLAVATARRVMR